MRSVRFRNIATGDFLPRVFTASDSIISANTPPGHEAVDAPPDALATLPGLDALPEPHRTLRARDQRDILLRASDWTQLADAPITPQEKQQWAAYRKALRDMPSSSTFPNDRFPNPPNNDHARR